MYKHTFKSLFLILFSFAGAALWAQAPSQEGQWSPPIDFGIVPVAVANLPDGRLIAWSSRFHDTFTEEGVGKTFTEIFDPSLGAHGQPLGPVTSQTDHDMFCPGINNLADGRILAAGGTSSELTSIYDPVSGTWSAADNMNITRGYQGNVTLSDGSVFTIGGSWSDGYANAGGRDAEQWTPETGWFLLPNIKSEILWNANDLSQEDRGIYRVDNHVWLWAAPNGKILHAGPGERMHWIDVANGGSWTDAGPRGSDTYSMKGTTVMFDVGKILKVGGARSYDSNDPAKDNSLVIDINNGDNVTVTPTGNNLGFSRTMHNSIVLPNGEVMVAGGLNIAQVFTDNGARYQAEIYSPTSNTWRTVAGMSIPRTYHSVGILMADGRVFVGGGGLCDATPGCVNHMDAEIYSPPYVFNSDNTLAARPVITSFPDQANWGQTINISTDSNVTGFSLIRFSSATHSTNNEQRRIPLATPGGTSHTLTMPTQNNAPPGLYMLFALNANGVPSVAKTIKIGNAIPLSNNPNLVAHYTFDEGSGSTVKDISGKNNNASILERNNAGNNVPLSQNYLEGSGILGGALEMDGSEFNSNSIMDIPYSASLAETQGEVTVMAWVYRNENEYNTGLFAHDYNRPGTFFGFHNALYKWEFYTNNGVVSCYAGYVPTNTWVHIVGTFNGSVAKLYANGKEISSKTLPQGTLLRHDPLKSFTSSGFYDIGRGISPVNGLTDEIDGRIDELKIYKKALGAVDIMAEFQAGMASGAPDLIACGPDAIKARYSIDGGATQSGNNITVAEGQNVVLSADTASATYYITSPNANANTRVTSPPGGGLTNVAPGALTLSNIQASSAGTYVLANTEGCMTTVKITVAGSCDAGDTPIQAEWSTDGGKNYFSAAQGQTANIMADLGNQVRLSILPNGLKFNVVLPDGNLVQNISGDYIMDNVTHAQSGSYFLESEQGCSVIINLMVHLGTCDASTIRAEWSLNGGSTYEEAPDNQPVTINADVGDNVRLSMVPNGIGFSITLPSGTTVDNLTTDYILGEVNTSDNGEYTITSDQGCSTSINLNVICPTGGFVPQYTINGNTQSGNSDITVDEGDSVSLGIIQDGTSFSITLPNGTIVQQGLEISGIDPQQAGEYTFTSELGCTQTLNINVTERCPTGGFVPQYTINGNTQSGNSDITVDEGDSVSLGIIQDGTSFSITLPNGTIVQQGLEISGIDPQQAGEYTFTSELGCTQTLNINVTERCPTGGFVPQYTINGNTQSGNSDITVDEGDSVSLGIIQDGTSFSITLPNGTIVQQGLEISGIDPQQAGEYTFTSELGCTQTLNINVTERCPTGGFVPQYTINGNTQSGNSDITVDEGDSVSLGIIQDGTSFSITLPNGTIVQQGLEISGIDPQQAGEYTFTSELGCTQTLNINVTERCPTGGFVPQYTINGNTQSGNSDITVDEGDSVSLGIIQDGTSFSITLPNGTIVQQGLEISGIDPQQAGEYTFTSELGCTQTLNINVTERCPTGGFVPQYTINGNTQSGNSDITVDEGDSVSLGIIQDGTSFSITLPNGTIVQQGLEISGIDPQQAGEYTFTSELGCTQTLNINVTERCPTGGFVPQYTINGNTQSGNSDITVDEGDSVSLGIIQDGTSFSITLPNGTIVQQGLEISGIDPQQAGEYTFTSELGCTQTLNINVTERCPTGGFVPQYTINGNTQSGNSDITVDEGDSVSLGIIQDGTSFSITLPNGTIVQQGLEISGIDPQQAGEYTFTSELGCTQTLNINVTERCPTGGFVPQYTINGNTQSGNSDITVDEGDSVSLGIIQDGTSFSITLPNGTIVQQGLEISGIDPQQAGEYTFTSELGCTQTLNINVTERCPTGGFVPQYTINGNTQSGNSDITVDEGDSVSLGIIQDGTSFSITLPNGTIVQQGLEISGIDPQQAGEYTFTSELGCTQTLNINVTERCPTGGFVPQYTINGNTQSGNSDITVDEGDSVSLGIIQDGTSFSITLPNGTIVQQGLEISGIDPQQAGEYTFTSELGCIQVLTIKVNPSAELSIPSIKDIITFPNPVNNEILSFMLKEFMEETIEISFYDIYGKLIQQNIIPSSHEEIIELNLSLFSSGTYIVIIKKNLSNEIKTQKIIKL